MHSGLQSVRKEIDQVCIIGTLLDIGTRVDVRMGIRQKPIEQSVSEFEKTTV